MDPSDQDPMLPRLFTVRTTQQETKDTTTLHLVPVDGDMASFQPGQFNMLYAFGTGEVPISISGDSAAADSLVHTIRAVGAVTEALCALQPGDTLGVRGPFGSAWPVLEAEGHDVLILTGGIGLAPLRPALYHILLNRIRYGQVSLLYGARSPGDLLFAEEVHRWRGQFDLDVLVTVDAALAKDAWYGHVGVVTQLIKKATFTSSKTIVLMCGPEIMMRYALRELLSQEIPEAQIYLSMERNMKCGIGHCGHCQYGPEFICQDGPVFPLPRIHDLLTVREI